MIRRVFVISVGCMLMGLFSFAQITPVITSDKEKIFIGEPFKVTLELKAIDRNAGVQWKFPDSIPHFEYVSFDTSDILKRVITITSFDSGLWSIDNIEVVVPSNVNDKAVLLKFPSKEILIEYDTTGSQVLNDVKPIIEVNAGEKRIGYAVAAAALLSLLLLIILFRRWKKKKIVIADEDSNYSPLEDFIRTIEKLKQQSWNEQLEQKQNFSELSQAVKRYFERILRQPFSRVTTDELMMDLKPHLLTEQLISITQTLRLADAVKFAKFTAPKDDWMNALAGTETVIKKLDIERKPND